MASASARISLIWARIHSASRLASNAASEPILVPSIAIRPSEARPALAHSPTTSTKTFSIAFSFSARKRAIVTWSGVLFAQITR